jgi:hypothetical protein
MENFESLFLIFMQLWNSKLGLFKLFFCENNLMTWGKTTNYCFNLKFHFSKVSWKEYRKSILQNRHRIRSYRNRKLYLYLIRAISEFPSAKTTCRTSKRVAGSRNRSTSDSGIYFRSPYPSWPTTTRLGFDRSEIRQRKCRNRTRI